MMRITRHAIDRAKQRWLCPDDESAQRAIERVVQEGECVQLAPHLQPHLYSYVLGSHIARFDSVTGSVFTVVVRGEKRVAALLYATRQDHKAKGHYTKGIHNSKRRRDRQYRTGPSR